MASPTAPGTDRSEAPTAVYTSELAATITPLPTKSPEEVEALVLELLDDNADCRLPCWWGATPGKTTWESTQPYLATFSTITSQPANNDDVFFVEIPIPDRNNPTVVYGGTYHVHDGVITSIQTGSGDEVTTYSLARLLSTYGQPNEVWVNAYSQTPDGTLPFRLTLVYRAGFVATYNLPSAAKDADLITGCFDQIAPYLWLVPSERNITFEEAHRESPQVGEDQYYLPLEEAVNMTVPEFYEVFKNPSNSACLETPAGLWP